MTGALCANTQMQLHREKHIKYIQYLLRAGQQTVGKFYKWMSERADEEIIKNITSFAYCQSMKACGQLSY